MSPTRACNKGHGEGQRPRRLGSPSSCRSHSSQSTRTLPSAKLSGSWQNTEYGSYLCHAAMFYMESLRHEMLPNTSTSMKIGLQQASSKACLLFRNRSNGRVSSTVERSSSLGRDTIWPTEAILKQLVRPPRFSFEPVEATWECLCRSHAPCRFLGQICGVLRLSLATLPHLL